MRASAALLSVTLLSCATARTNTAEVAREAPPRLLVAIVVDQLGSDTLLRYLPHLDPDGAFRRTMDRGVFVPRARYAYGATFTAPGHVAIFSGASPSESGIAFNDVYDAALATKKSVVNDGEHATFRNQAFASPRRLQAETVADVLHEASGGAAKIAAVSIKDRAAVLSGGQACQAAFWYDNAVGRFTSSRYYFDALPGWFSRWEADHPVDALIAPWTPERPALYEELLGPDDRPGEADWGGFGRTFPHHPGRSRAPLKTLRATPASTLHLLGLARAAVDNLALGKDSQPDLLVVSVSGTDYVGHVFGPGSWEYLDNLVKVDRALGAFLAALEREGPIATLITSDHGAAPLPEGTSPAGRRVAPSQLVRRLDAAVDAELGEGDWVAAYAKPLISFTPQAQAHRPQVVQIVTRTLEATGAFDVILDTEESQEGLRPEYRAALVRNPPGDVFALPGRMTVLDPEIDDEHGGTTHGTRFGYDTDVPVVFHRPGLRRHRIDEVVAQRRVSATLSWLLGVRPPRAAAGVEPLVSTPR